MKRQSIPEEVMEERRRERLRQLTFFMLDDRVPPNARRVMSLGTCLNLLTGFFQNSRWRTFKWVAGRTFEHARMCVAMEAWFFWHVKVLRQSPEKIDELLERD